LNYEVTMEQTKETHLPVDHIWFQCLKNTRKLTKKN
jgi:hypothetical protein